MVYQNRNSNAELWTKRDLTGSLLNLQNDKERANFIRKYSIKTSPGKVGMRNMRQTGKERKGKCFLSSKPVTEDNSHVISQFVIFSSVNY